MYIDADNPDIRTWLEKRDLGEFAPVFEQHKIDFEILGDLTFDDIKEMGIDALGPRRKIFREITQWRDEREAKKAEVIRAKMETHVAPPANDAVEERLQRMGHTMGRVRATLPG